MSANKLSKAQQELISNVEAVLASEGNFSKYGNKVAGEGFERILFYATNPNAGEVVYLYRANLSTLEALEAKGEIYFYKPYGSIGAYVSIHGGGFLNAEAQAKRIVAGLKIVRSSEVSRKAKDWTTDRDSAIIDQVLYLLAKEATICSCESVMTTDETEAASKRRQSRDLFRAMNAVLKFHYGDDDQKHDYLVRIQANEKTLFISAQETIARGLAETFAQLGEGLEDLQRVINSLVILKNS